MMINELGNRYGKLLVVKKATTCKRYHVARWTCKCDCGVRIVLSGVKLRRGANTSCGCSHPRRNYTEYLKTIKRVLATHYNNYLQGSKRRNLEFSISKRDFERLCRKVCYYCGNSPSMKRWKYVDWTGETQYIKDYLNGLDRVDSSKGYNLKNVVPCCKRCNLMKLNLPVTEFFSHIQKIITYQKKSIDINTNIV